MSGFANSFFNALGQLIKQSIKSPNYVAGTSGWSINKDGSGEFNNLTIRGTFNGADFVINLAGIFFYNGSPALGNLVGWWTISAGTDPYGNTYTAGLVVTDGTSLNHYVQIDQLSGQVAIFFQPDATSMSQGNITAHVSGSTPSMQIASPQSTTAGSVPAVLTLTGSDPGGTPGAEMDVSCDTFIAGLLVADDMQAWDPSTLGVVETWHAIPYAAQWSNDGNPNQPGEYRLNADGSVSLRGRARFTSNGTTGLSAGGTTLCTMPAAYRPATNHNQGWPVPVYGSPTISANRIPSLVIGQTGAGVITLFNVSSVVTNGTVVSVDLSGTYWP